MDHLLMLIDGYKDIPFTFESQYAITQAYLEIIEFCAARDLKIPPWIMDDYNWKRSAWERSAEMHMIDEPWAENDFSDRGDDDLVTTEEENEFENELENELFSLVSE